MTCTEGLLCAELSSKFFSDISASYRYTWVRVTRKLFRMSQSHELLLLNQKNLGGLRVCIAALSPS